MAPQLRGEGGPRGREGSGIYFTTPHFDRHRNVLIRLETVPTDELEELIIEVCIDRAPRRLCRPFIEDRGPG